MKRHWLVKTLLVIILMLFLAAVLGIGFLHTSPGRKRVYSWLQDYLLANQGIRLETEELRYNLFDLAVTLHQTQLWSRRSPDLPPILTADRMYIDLSLMSLLLDGFLAIEDARIDSPEIRVVVLKDGRSNLPVSEKDVEEEAGGLPDFLIESFRLERGSFTFTDHQSGLRAHLGSWNTAINGDKTSLSHDLTLSAGEGQLAQGAREVPLKRLSLRARIPSNLDRVTIEDLEIESPAAVLEVSGTVDELENPRLAVRITADAVLASISDLMDLRPPLSGRVHWDGEARNGLKDLQVTGKVTGENISYESLEQVNLSSRVLWDMARGRLILSGLSVSSPGTTLAGEADLSTQASGRNSASLEISRLDLEQLMRGLNLDVRFASQATGRVQAAWVSGDLDAGNLQVDLEFSRRAPEASPDVLPLSGSIRLRKEGEEARVQVERIETIGAGIEADIRVSSLSNLQERPDGRLSGRIDAQATDLLRLTTGLARFLGETSPLLGTEVAGSARVQAQVGGTLRQPAVTAEMSADSVRVGGLEGVSLNTAANYRQDRLTIEQGIIGWAREQIRFDGTVSNLRSGNPALDVNARLEEGTIENFFLALGRPSPVQGRLRLLASAQGTVANPQLRADIRASELHAYGEALGTLEGEATLQNRFLVSRLMLQKPSSPSRLDLQASYRFDDQSYELEADAPRFEITSLEAGDRVLTGVFSLRAAGKGALPDPKGALQLDAHSLRYGDDVLGDLQARAEVQNREAVVTATAPRFNFKLDGRVGVEAPHPAQFAARFQGTDLSLLPLTRANAPAGNLEAEVTGEGTLRDLANASAAARLESLTVTAHGQTLRNEGPMSIEYANRMVRFDSVKLASGPSSLEIGGSVPLDPEAGQGKMTLAANVDLQTITALLPQAQRVEAKGTLAVRGTISGNLKALDPNVNILLRDAVFQASPLRTPVSEISLAASLGNDAAVVQSLQARIGEATVSAEATIPYGLLPGDLPIKKSAGPARVQAEVRDFNLRSISAVPENVSGNVSIELQAEAPRADLQAVTGTATLPEFELTMEDLEINQERPTVVRLDSGRAVIEHLRLSGPGATLEASGSMALGQPGDLDIQARGKINPAIAELFVEDLNIQGETTLELSAKGTRSKPSLDGYLEVNQVQLQLEEPEVSMTDLSGRLNFEGNRVAIERLTGTINGGALEAGGAFAYESGALRDVSIEANARDFFIEYPEGLQLGMSADLQLRSAERDQLLLAGRVGISEGAYTRSFGIWTEMLNQFRGDDDSGLIKEEQPSLSRLNLRIDIDTEQPIVFDNNLAQVLVVTDLRLTGTLDRPGLTGRLNVLEGGEIYLQERDYLVERGTVTFVNETSIEPVLDVEARTQVGDNEITLQLTGPADDLEANFTSSNPPLPEPDIISLLVTGRTLSELRGSETEVATEQALSLLSGDVAQRVGSGLERATGLSQVRVEPELIAGESDPGARLTIGQDITKDLELVYSMNLIDSSDQIYIANYQLSRAFGARVSHHTNTKVSQTNPNQNLYRFEFNHRLLFGLQPGFGEAEKSDREERKVGEVTFTGNPVLPLSDLQDKFDVKSGQNYNFFKIREGLDRLENLYRKQDYLEARIRFNREESPERIDISVDIQAGPRVELSFLGFEPPDDLRERVTEVWAGGVFDSQRAADAIQEIRTYLASQNFLAPQVRYEISETSGDYDKTGVFQVEPGDKYQEVRLRFPGAEQVPAKRLEQYIYDTGLEKRLFTDPEAVQKSLKAFYAQSAFLEAKVKEIDHELDSAAGVATVVIPIEEGELYRVGEFSFNGNKVFEDRDLANVLKLRAGDVYDTARVRDSIQVIETLYRRKGYTDVEVRHTAKRDAESGRIILEFNIEENRQKVVTEVSVSGQNRTSAELVRNQLELKAGDLLDPEKVAQSRVNLYDTGAYSLIEIESEEIQPDPDPNDNQQPVRLVVSVQEVPPFEFRYGGSYDTDRGPGVVGDLTNRNSLGHARLLRFRGRFDQRAREVRGIFSQPSLLSLPFETSLTAYGLREIDDEADFTTDRFGVSIRQEALLADHYVLSYGYRFERARTTGLFDGGDLSLTLAPLSITLTRDTRDDLLDATEGAFTSHAVEYAPALLGSDLRYVRYYGQFYRYIALSEPSEIPWIGVEKPRLVYAGAVRLGLAQGLGGQELIPSERFFAGGETTVRGFRRDALGPLNAIGRPSGGEAVFVMNNELRFPLFSVFDGVGFIDVGNVYPDWRDFDPFRVRASYGFGLRIRTPFVLIRADYGLKLDRRPDESVGAFFISIGQAF